MMFLYFFSILKFDNLNGTEGVKGTSQLYALPPPYTCSRNLAEPYIAEEVTITNLFIYEETVFNFFMVD